jgi:YHS domain-containing protein/thiol-disulfide isomerase/thioredoxin
MRKLLVETMLWNLLLAGSAAVLADGPSVWKTDFEQARAEAAQTGKPMLVHFYAEWCGPCKQMEQKVLHQKSIEAEIQQRVVAVMLDVDQNGKLAKRLGVEKLPTDLIMEPTGAGAQLLETQGFHPIEEYRQEVIIRGANRYAEVLAQRQKKSQEPHAVAKIAQADAASPDRLMLEGYCPVTLWKNRRWVKGSAELKVEHQGQMFYFADEVTAKEFKENPERYVPRFMGCDAIVVAEASRALKGETKFAAFYDDELYMFTTEENRKKFKSNPDKYTRTRVVFDVTDIESVTR